MHTAKCKCLVSGSCWNSMAVHAAPVHSNWHGTTEHSNIKKHHKVMQVTAVMSLCRHLTMLILIAFNDIISHINPW